MKGQKTLRWILLSAITSEEDFPQEVKMQRSKVNDKIAFEWAYGCFLVQARHNKRSLHQECKEWFEGIPFAIPFEYEEIENLGLNSETYFSDLATVFLNEVQS